MSDVKTFQVLVGAAAIFTLLWILLYERRPADEPSRAERFLARGWLLFRRTVCFAVAAFFAFVAVGMAFDPAAASLASRLGPILFCVFVAGMAFWVGLYGGGRRKTMSDDRAVHEERKKRYGWRW